MWVEVLGDVFSIITGGIIAIAGLIWSIRKYSLERSKFPKVKLSQKIQAFILTNKNVYSMLALTTSLVYLSLE